jgi:phosphoribosyl 1,2-cyclic phosphate phosphodiesterase
MPLAAIADPETMGVLRHRFGYGFIEVAGLDAYGPRLSGAEMAGPFCIGDIEVTSFWQSHGSKRTLGYRFGSVAYSTDVNALDEAAFAALEGVDVWVVDCLRMEPHPTHSHFAQTLAWIQRVRPRRAILTHMNQSLDYDVIASLCPPGVEPGYDGLVVQADDRPHAAVNRPARLAEQRQRVHA